MRHHSSGPIARISGSAREGARRSGPGGNPPPPGPFDVVTITPKGYRALEAIARHRRAQSLTVPDRRTGGGRAS